MKASIVPDGEPTLDSYREWKDLKSRMGDEYVFDEIDDRERDYLLSVALKAKYDPRDKKDVSEIEELVGSLLADPLAYYVAGRKLEGKIAEIQTYRGREA